MKRIIPVLLLCLYLAGSGGIYYGYRIAQYFHYIQVRNHLINHSLQNELKLLVINKEDALTLHWKKLGKEFELRGQLYDVARIDCKKGISYMYCYKDTKENRLITLFNQKKPGNHTLRNILSKILLTNCILPNSGTGILPQVTKYVYLSFHSFLISSKSDILLPPPKRLCFS